MQKIIVLVTAGALATFTVLAVLKARFSTDASDSAAVTKRVRERSAKKK